MVCRIPMKSTLSALSVLLLGWTTVHADLRFLGHGHTDLALNYTTNECILVVGELGKLALPGGTPFGNEGDPLYIIPQSQNPDLLYLGISTEGIAGGVFQGNLNVRLKSINGPGQFFLWQASSFGDFNVKMNTADGISAADLTTPLFGSHEYYNWVFTARGLYHLTFQVVGRRLGDTADITSADTPFTFQVLPLPAAAAILRTTQVPANGDLQIEITGSSGVTYRLETSGDLSHWIVLKNVTLTGATAAVAVPTNDQKLFVRAIAKELD